MRLILLMLVLACACRPTPPSVASCREPLTGVWLVRNAPAVPAAPLRGDERLGFDIRDQSDGIAVYPLWDSSRPPGGKAPTAPVLSPWRISLTRAGEAAVGTVAWRVTQGGQTCAIKQPARLSACQNRSAMLAITLAASVDPSTCAIAAPPSRLEFKLERQ